jgi:Mn-containing catalase
LYLCTISFPLFFSDVSGTLTFVPLEELRGIRLQTAKSLATLLEEKLERSHFGEMSTLMNYRDISKVWNGPHPEDGSGLVVEDAIPAGSPPPDLAEQPQLTAPSVDMAMLKDRW